MNNEFRIKIGIAFIESHNEVVKHLFKNIGSNIINRDAALHIYERLESGAFGVPIFTADCKEMTWSVKISPAHSHSGLSKIFKWNWKNGGS